jgi:hypothetical protein
MFFTPSSYNLHFQVEYAIDGATNQDSVEYQLSIRAPLLSLMTGAIAGSILGHLLFDALDPTNGLFNPTKGGWLGILAAYLASILISIVAVIAFARKKDAQPLISVEDFWGGMFVGFMAGYSGKLFLGKILGK